MHGLNYDVSNAYTQDIWPNICTKCQTTNRREFTPIHQLFAIIRVIRVFRVGFPRKVLEIADRCVTGRTWDRAEARQE
jgi:hypothetical protein